MSELQIIVLAAGKGTRMNSKLPKVCVKTFDQVPLIHHVCRFIDDLRKLYNCLKPIFVLGHEGDTVKKSISEYRNIASDIDHEFAHVIQEPQLGTGHALMAVKEKLGLKPVDTLVLYGDVPNMSLDMIKALIHEHQGNHASFISFDAETPNGYGKVLRDHEGQFLAIRENKDCSVAEQQTTEANSGICIFDGKFLQENLDRLTNDNQNQEYYLVDLINFAAKVAVMKAPQAILGVNSPRELTALNQELIKENREFILNRYGEQLVIHDLETLYIAKSVRFTGKEQIVIGPNTTLLGDTIIDEGCVLEGTTYLLDARIGANTTIKFGSKITDATIGSDCQIGPFAHIRPQSEIKSTCKIGNFVEVKKSTIDEASAVSHLSYIGDTSVGKHVNIGAGTITCNYDGINKHRTTIKDGAFIGSNSSLVAPVTVGQNSLIGAGSVVTKDSPDNSLYITRAKAVIKENWRK